MRLSVVVPAFNEALSIRRCLQSLASQKTRFPFEVVSSTTTPPTTRRKLRAPSRLPESCQSPFRALGLPDRRVTKRPRERLFSTQTPTPSFHLIGWSKLGGSSSSSQIRCSCQARSATPSGRFSHSSSRRSCNWGIPRRWLLTRRLAVVNGCNFAVRRTALIEAGGFPSDLPEIGDSRILGPLRRAGRVAWLRHCGVRTSARRFLAQGVLSGRWLLFHRAAQLNLCNIRGGPHVPPSRPPCRKLAVVQSGRTTSAPGPPSAAGRHRRRRLRLFGHQSDLAGLRAYLPARLARRQDSRPDL